MRNCVPQASEWTGDRTLTAAEFFARLSSVFQGVLVDAAQQCTVRYQCNAGAAALPV